MTVKMPETNDGQRKQITGFRLEAPDRSNDPLGDIVVLHLTLKDQKGCKTSVSYSITRGMALALERDIVMGLL